MILKELIKGLKTRQILAPKDVEILGISYNSRLVQEGFLFAAIDGEKTDGHNYIDSAIGNGAKALLVERIPRSLSEDIATIEVEDTMSSLARVSANFFGHPTKHFTLVGVTGTNGKTTTAYLIESIWREEGKNAGVIGTVEYRFSGKSVPAPMTTPESLDLMKMFSEMRNSGT
ncbi:MAG: Mur ligase family protein, partial [Thermodesulfobacteriota bacterium]